MQVSTVNFEFHVQMPKAQNEGNNFSYLDKRVVQFFFEKNGQREKIVEDVITASSTEEQNLHKYHFSCKVGQKVHFKVLEFVAQDSVTPVINDEFEVIKDTTYFSRILESSPLIAYI